MQLNSLVSRDRDTLPPPAFTRVAHIRRLYSNTFGILKHVIDTVFSAQYREALGCPFKMMFGLTDKGSTNYI
jgi:hypothetical protein